jgi:hypothetical protein
VSIYISIIVEDQPGALAGLTNINASGDEK